MSLERKFFLGFIRIHILYHASITEIYGVEMMDELRTHGYEVGPGTIYPILHSLEEDGFLTIREENVNGKIRKYYSITSKGIEILNKARLRIKELIDELMD
ncbi:MAG: PadR family transcriptional regulator [Methanobacterium sp.]|jgi:DNA-binding PadR family transcriptional regulator